MITLFKTIFSDLFLAGLIAAFITYVAINYFIRIMNKMGVIPVISYSKLFKIFKILFIICSLIVFYNSCEDYINNRKVASQIKNNSNTIQITTRKSQPSENDKSISTSNNTENNTENTITNEQALSIVKKIDADDKLKIIDKNFTKDNKTYIIIEPIPESDHNFAVDKITGKLYAILPDSSMTPIQ